MRLEGGGKALMYSRLDRQLELKHVSPLEESLCAVVTDCAWKSTYVEELRV